ncbi:SIR2 family NAD-dependent protein deacylase [Microbulbifer pacificus]|uniref:protein acetyllysine N-acetyltransferase n=1 Tax=Microbulbifer pacificus TaxID=407164 RepID=A0AAU0MVP4_9GAMM|nr:Sir2 family NAD-dependent protein deacetylase [Microbulbifer pacificus]WOX04614.1 Sir2 family NAD-dependent protein deacetylase [Microbulbifer pacificus]
MELTELATQAASAIRRADGLLITGGAGMGVDSGLPDFRGNEGFWRAYPALAEAGLSFVEIADPEHFHSYPERAWGFYGHRLNLYRRVQPHAGFQLLLAITEKLQKDYFVFTSNVDGHYAKAGFDPERIFECHGSIHHFQCAEDCASNIWQADNHTVEVDEQRCLAIGAMPRCSDCGGVARPNILMFGDWHWNARRAEMQQARYENWLRGIGNLVTIECGAGTAIPTVRNQGEYLDGTLIRINPRESQSTHPNAICMAAGAREAISRIAAKLGIE